MLTRADQWLQVTSPWIEDNDYVLGVTENAFSLVRDLTHMCAHTKVIITIIIINTIPIITIILSVTRPSSLALLPWLTSPSCPR